MALISVLVMVAILTLTLVAFVNTTMLDSSASQSYSQSFKADQLASGGAWWVVKELQEEMSADAAPTMFGPYAVYTNLNATNIMPRPVGTNSAMLSLVKMSLAGTPAYPPGAYQTAGGVIPTSVSTATKSLNGRSVGTNRWDEAYLGTFPSSTSLPSWITVTRAGPTSSTNLSQLKNIEDATNYAVGRYAYAVYDEGGLININVSGYPSTFGDGSSLSAADAARKGTPGLIDLTAVPGLSNASDINALILWRNASTAASTNSFLSAQILTNTISTNADAILSVTNVIGTVTNISTQPYVAPGDNAFLSRQDLIAYAQAHNIATALPYLTTFSRDLNAPSFAPTALVTAAMTPAAIPAAYPNTNNPNVLFERDATSQPLVKQRFPLSNLALFSNPTVNAGAINTNFGLTLNGDGYSWNYRSTSTILTLDQVAALNPPRNPDFFEMLQAAVLNGSLVPYTGTIYNNVANQKVLPTYPTIMRMGANLIDQYKADGMPTVINFNAEKIAGVENLPYFTEMLFWPYRPLSDPTRATLKGYFLVELWNPHQNATTLSANGPAQLRCILTTSDQSKGAAIHITTYGTYGGSSSTNIVNPDMLNYPSTATLPAVVFTNSPTFSEPHLLDATTVVADPTQTSTNWQTVSENGNTRSGFLVLSNSIPDQRITPSAPVKWTEADSVADGGSGLGVQLQFKDSKGNWQPYQGGSGTGGATNLTQVFWGPVSGGALRAYDTAVSPYPPAGATSANCAAFTNFFYVGSVSFFLSDPRSIWNGMALGDSTVNQTIRPNTTTPGAGLNGGVPSIPANATYTIPDVSLGDGSYQPNTAYTALYNENNAPKNTFMKNNGLGSVETYFRDQDGVLRGGDGYYGGNPFLAGASTNRPIILNRPFRSVGEMGYAFRGNSPWKTIDFFTSASADAGLLDYFSVDASPEVSGRINLNTRQPVTLQAALQGAYQTESPLQTLTPAESTAIASAITNLTTSQQFANRADLVRSFSTNAVFTDIIKTRREATVRALGDLGTTRTWNLMIDVVAQVGHYPATATDLSQFMVEGERRYWLHVAIDRFTGKVIDSQLEPYEE